MRMVEQELACLPEIVDQAADMSARMAKLEQALVALDTALDDYARHTIKLAKKETQDQAAAAVESHRAKRVRQLAVLEAKLVREREEREENRIQTEVDKITSHVTTSAQSPSQPSQLQVRTRQAQAEARLEDFLNADSGDVTVAAAGGTGDADSSNEDEDEEEKEHSEIDSRPLSPTEPPEDRSLTEPSKGGEDDDDQGDATIDDADLDSFYDS